MNIYAEHCCAQSKPHGKSRNRYVTEIQLLTLCWKYEERNMIWSITLLINWLVFAFSLTLKCRYSVWHTGLLCSIRKMHRTNLCLFKNVLELVEPVPNWTDAGWWVWRQRGGKSTGRDAWRFIQASCPYYHVLGQSGLYCQRRSVPCLSSTLKSVCHITPVQSKGGRFDNMAKAQEYRLAQKKIGLHIQSHRFFNPLSWKVHMNVQESGSTSLAQTSFSYRRKEAVNSFTMWRYSQFMVPISWKIPETKDWLQDHGRILHMYMQTRCHVAMLLLYILKLLSSFRPLFSKQSVPYQLFQDSQETTSLFIQNQIFLE